MSSHQGKTYYTNPTLYEGMEWVDSLTEHRGGCAEVLMSMETDKQGRKYIQIAVRHYYVNRQRGWELMEQTELRSYAGNFTSVGAILMKLAHQLEHKLSERERLAETQAHF